MIGSGFSTQGPPYSTTQGLSVRERTYVYSAAVAHVETTNWKNQLAQLANREAANGERF